MLRALVLELSLPKGSVVVDFCVILETSFFFFSVRGWGGSVVSLCVLTFLTVFACVPWLPGSAAGGGWKAITSLFTRSLASLCTPASLAGWLGQANGMAHVMKFCKIFSKGVLGLASESSSLHVALPVPAGSVWGEQVTPHCARAALVPLGSWPCSWHWHILGSSEPSRTFISCFWERKPEVLWPSWISCELWRVAPQCSVGSLAGSLVAVTEKSSWCGLFLLLLEEPAWHSLVYMCDNV